MIYDVIVIGAGPCGLAVAARLRESTPSALFTDAEHARYWRRHARTRKVTVEEEARKKRRQARHVSRQDFQQINACERKSSEYGDDFGEDGNMSSQLSGVVASPSMLVLDASSEEWLSRWKSRFEDLEISHLRSPLFFHCDPRDRDGLLEFSHAQERTSELVEISNVVGREVSKHQKKKGKKRTVTRYLHLDNRDQIDYYTPSSSLFHDYCTSLIDRYDLAGITQKATVMSIRYGLPSILTEGSALFTLTTSTEQVFLARTVVVAVGPGTRPGIPTDCSFLESGSASHAFATPTLLPPHLSVNSACTRRQSLISIAVLGGGLTSAQIVSLLLTRHCQIDKVHLILRSKLKVKHFDVDLKWISKFRNANMAAFWSADSDEERFEMLRAARGGGSVPPFWAKLLRQHEKQGKLQCWQDTKLVGGSWNAERSVWDYLDLESSNKEDKFEGCRHGAAGDGKDRMRLKNISHVICATGMAPSIENVDFLSEMRNAHPIPSIAGLPQLNDDLKWNSEVPLFLTGALAGLGLGPGAGNLAGARLGAERVTWGIRNILDNTKEVQTRQKESMTSRKRSETDSAYWSAVSSDSNDVSPDDHENEEVAYSYSTKDRSEFTGGYTNQFEALTL